MLITDKGEIIRLKLLHHIKNRTILEFAERYVLDKHCNLVIKILALVKNNGLSIICVERNGKSERLDNGNYGGSESGDSNIIDHQWNSIKRAIKPTGDFKDKRPFTILSGR